jgi:hypothetical protein
VLEKELIKASTQLDQTWSLDRQLESALKEMSREK